MKPEKVYRPDGSWYHVNVRPSRRTERRKEKERAVEERKREDRAA